MELLDGFPIYPQQEPCVVLAELDFETVGAGGLCFGQHVAYGPCGRPGTQRVRSEGVTTQKGILQETEPTNLT